MLFVLRLYSEVPELLIHVCSDSDDSYHSKSEYDSHNHCVYLLAVIIFLSGSGPDTFLYESSCKKG